MALRRNTIRKYLKRIIEIKRVIGPALIEEVNSLGTKLGTGTYRLADVPGTVVVISPPRTASGGGYTVDWKSVAWDLADKFHIPEYQVLALVRKHNRPSSNAAASPNVGVSVRQDKAKAPKSTDNTY